MSPGYEHTAARGTGGGGGGESGGGDGRGKIAGARSRGGGGGGQGEGTSYITTVANIGDRGSANEPVMSGNDRLISAKKPVVVAKERSISSTEPVISEDASSRNVRGAKGRSTSTYQQYVNLEPFAQQGGGKVSSGTHMYPYIDIFIYI